jgi:tetratricopeptide (TPR) repeat protein
MAAVVGPKPVPETIDTAKQAPPPKSESKQSRPDAAVAAKLSATVASPTTIALRMETALEMRSLKEPSTAPRATPAPPVDRAKPVPLEAPGKVASAAATQEALAQAQTLWNAGSKDAAAELLRDAVSIAERSAGPNGANATLIALVRELTRMQLAEGHFGAVWDLLNRLEPHLGNQADLWAIRANAAQRLGRHQDSVHAYMVALQSRPTEQRWLLGSAVSLAALGQIASAAEMADKARAAGPISKDVQAYLRQMNVPVRD